MLQHQESENLQEAALLVGQLRDENIENGQHTFQATDVVS
jgi:hypothetical protein